MNRPHSPDIGVFDQRPRVYEPDEKITHYASPVGLDQVTICGITDWMGKARGKPTKRALTCFACTRIAAFFLDAAPEPTSPAIGLTMTGLDPVAARRRLPGSPGFHEADSSWFASNAGTTIWLMENEQAIRETLDAVAAVKGLLSARHNELLIELSSWILEQPTEERTALSESAADLVDAISAVRSLIQGGGYVPRPLGIAK